MMTITRNEEEDKWEPEIYTLCYDVIIYEIHHDISVSLRLSTWVISAWYYHLLKEFHLAVSDFIVLGIIDIILIIAIVIINIVVVIIIYDVIVVVISCCDVSIRALKLPYSPADDNYSSDQWRR